MKLAIFISFNLLFYTFANARILERIEAVVDGQMVLQSEVENFKTKVKEQSLVNQNLMGLYGIDAKSTRNEI